MKAYVSQILLIAAFVAISIVPHFYLVQRQKRDAAQLSGVNKQIMGVKAQNESRGVPVRLKIPKINVNAAIQYVGVASKGDMEVPSNATDVGWFKLGPRPGEIGSAVISGHLDGKNGEAGVFINLYKLKKGDKLYVEDGEGTTTAFMVRESRIYNPGYAEEVFSSNDSVYLNLITCDGVWDGAKKSFSKRLVIFADLVQ